MSELKSETFEGLEGYWLRSGGGGVRDVSAIPARGGVSTDRRAIAAVDHDGQPVFRGADVVHGAGAVGRGAAAGVQAGQARATGERSLRVTAGEEPTTGLQVVMEVSLEADQAALVIRHGLKNLREKTRRLAGWAINVVRIAAWP